MTNDEFNELPPDLRILTDMDVLANKYPNHIRVEETNRSKGNPNIREQIRAHFAGQLKKFGIATSTDTLMAFLRLFPEAGCTEMNVQEHGNIFTMSMTKVLDELKLEVPKGRVWFIPARVVRKAGNLGPCLILDFAKRADEPAPPKSETNNKKGKGKGKAGATQEVASTEAKPETAKEDPSKGPHAQGEQPKGEQPKE